MFEVLIREAAARFGVGDKALPLVQMLLAAMTAKDTGGLAGFLEKFKAAGLGPLAQSWLGGDEGAQPISNSQVEAVLGTSGGLLPALTAQLELPRDQVTEAIGYLLPALAGRLTPGGNLPASLSPDIARYAQAGQGLLAQAAQAMQTAQRAGSGSGPKWLTWAIIVIVVLAALYAWNARRHARAESTPAAAPALPAPPAQTQPSVPRAVFGGSAPPQPVPAASTAPAAAPPALNPPAAASATESSGNPPDTARPTVPEASAAPETSAASNAPVVN